MAKDLNYQTIDRPFNVYLQRPTGDISDVSRTQETNSSTYGQSAISLSGAGIGGQAAQQGGQASTQTVKDGSAMGDIWIRTFIRSESWKPKSVGFYIDGQTGYAEFSNIYVSGVIESAQGSIGGFQVGTDYIRDIADSFGLSSAVTGGDDIRFWAGSTLANRATAPFSITESGVVKATSGTIGGNVLSSTSISSSTFVSGPLGLGWRVLSTGSAEFQDVTIRGVIRTSVFEKDTISAVNGMVMVSKADVLSASMTALDSSTLTISGETTFVNNEVIRIKDGTDDEWMLVTDASGAPTYVVTRDLAGNYSSNSNPAWAKGTAVVSMGVGTGTKTGFVLLDSSSSNSPFIDVYGRNSNTYSDYTLHGRFGWLKGIVDATVGLNNTDVWGLYTDNAYIKGTIVATSGTIGGFDIGADYIRDVANSFGLASTVTGGDDVRFWAGATFANRATAPLRILESGSITAMSGFIGTSPNGITINSSGLVITGSGTIGTDVSPNNRIQFINSGTYGHGLEGYDTSNTLRWSWNVNSDPYLRGFTGANDFMRIFPSGTSGSGDVILIQDPSTPKSGFTYDTGASGANSTARQSAAGFYFYNRNADHGDGLVLREGYSGTWDGNFIRIRPSSMKNIDALIMDATSWSAVSRPSRITTEGYIDFPQFHHRSEFNDSPDGTALASTVISNAYWVGGGTSGTQTVKGGSGGGTFSNDTWSYLELDTTSTASRSSTATARRNGAITNESLFHAMVKVNGLTTTKWEFGWWTNATNYYLFRFDTDVSASNIYLVHRTGGSETLTDTGVDADSGSFHWFRLQVYPAGVVYATIDDTVCTVGSPSVPSAGAPYFYIDNKATAVSRQMQVDCVDWWYGRTVTP